MLKMLKKWASEVKDLLNNHGFSYVFERQHVLDKIAIK